MKILHLNTESGFRGGERQMELLMLGLRDRGHEQVLACRSGSEAAAHISALGFRVEPLKRPALLGARSPLLARRLRSLAEQFQPDIIHAHTGNAHTLAVSAFAGRVPIVVTRRVDFPVRENRATRRKYLAGGQHYIAISSGIRDILLAAGIPAGRITLVPSGTDFSRVRGGDGAALRRAWLDGREGPLIGFLGALVDHKAPWILAQAAALAGGELPGLRVVFVGDGPERARLEALRAQHPGLMELAGWRDDVADCYAAFDVFVMPSKLEGLCTALIDALAAGVPAVASNTGGIPDVLVDGTTGLLVPPLDAPALAGAIVRLWRDAPLRERLVAGGLAHADAHFTAESMVEGTLAVYEAALGS